MDSKKTLSVLTHLTVFIAAAISVVPPVFFFALDYGHEQAAVTVEAEINARIVGQLISSNPELWVFEQMRLEDLLGKRPLTDNRPEVRSIFGPNKKLIAQSKDEIAPPYITGQASLYDSGRQVGYMTVVRSMRPALNQAALVFLVSSLFGLMVFFIVRNLPLRALRQAFNDLAEEKEKAQITLQSIGDAVITTDARMRVEYLNSIAETLTGWSSEEAKGLPVETVFKIYGETSRLPAENPVKACLDKKSIVEIEGHVILLRRTDNEEFHIEISAAPIRRYDGSVMGVVMVFHNVTDRKIAQNHLQHIAFHDTLTGLPNRALFMKKLAKAMADARLQKKYVAVLFLDLDRFKTINDSLGHGIGDEILILVAKRLQECIRDSDVICRMGGDEFTAVLSNINLPENAGAIAGKIIESINKPFSIQGRELRISTSIGITIYPHDGEDLESLLKNADTAMYYAKSQGRNNYQYYDAAMSVKAAITLHMESALFEALENDEYFLEYQPKLDLNTNRIVGCEALLRWRNREFGRIMPVDFIPRLEESGAIIPVGCWVLKTAVGHAKQWQDAGYPIAVSVNVSARQFKQSGLVEQVAALLNEAGLPPSLLQIEITESILMEDSDRSEVIMRDLIKIGVKVSLDDFGTGYSSLSYLRRFPINELKIDRSFVVDLGTNETANKIIKTVIELGQALGMKVTAEGVQTEKQRSHLKSIGCDEIQGYLLSHPLSKDAFEALILKMQSQSIIWEENAKDAVKGPP